MAEPCLAVLDDRTLGALRLSVRARRLLWVRVVWQRESDVSNPQAYRRCDSGRHVCGGVDSRRSVVRWRPFIGSDGTRCCLMARPAGVRKRSRDILPTRRCLALLDRRRTDLELRHRMHFPIRRTIERRARVIGWIIVRLM